MRSIGTRRLSRRNALSAGVVAALLTLAPLTTLAAEGEPEGVTGVDWVLTGLAFDGTMGPVHEGVSPTLRLDPPQGDEDGQVSGSTGCNSFSGSYTLDTTSLTGGQWLVCLLLAGVLIVVEEITKLVLRHREHAVVQEVSG